MKKKRDVSEYTPMNDQVIVKIIKERTKSSGGILLPDGSGFADQGGDSDFYKVEVVKYTDKALEINPDLTNHKYGLVSIFSGHYLMTTEGSYKSIPAFMLVAMTNEVSFSAESMNPTINRILVKEIPESDQLASGLFIAGDMEDPREKDTKEGEIISIGILAKENLNPGQTAIYDPYVGNILPRLINMEEVNITTYERKQEVDGPVEHEPVVKKEKVTYKVVHEHDITLVY